MAGAATVVCLQQLKGILGLEHFTHGTDLVSVMRSVFSQTHQVFHLESIYFSLSMNSPRVLAIKKGCIFAVEMGKLCARTLLPFLPFTD